MERVTHGLSNTKLSYHLLEPQSESVADGQLVYGMVPPMLHPRSVKIWGIERAGLKALLIIDNASGNPEAVCYDDENVQVVFLSPNTISMHQHLN